MKPTQENKSVDEKGPDEAKTTEVTNLKHLLTKITLFQNVDKHGKLSQKYKEWWRGNKGVEGNRFWETEEDDEKCENLLRTIKSDVTKSLDKLELNKIVSENWVRDNPDSEQWTSQTPYIVAGEIIDKGLSKTDAFQEWEKHPIQEKIPESFSGLQEIPSEIKLKLSSIIVKCPNMSQRDITKHSNPSAQANGLLASQTKSPLVEQIDAFNTKLDIFCVTFPRTPHVGTPQIFNDAWAEHEKLKEKQKKREESDTCPKCGGTKYIRPYGTDDPSGLSVICPQCNGTGKIKREEKEEQ